MHNSGKPCEKSRLLTIAAGEAGIAAECSLNSSGRTGCDFGCLGSQLAKVVLVEVRILSESAPQAAHVRRRSTAQHISLR
jgi:hypothetical protein